jgi:hypothetical protein
MDCKIKKKSDSCSWVDACKSGLSRRFVNPDSCYRKPGFFGWTVEVPSQVCNGCRAVAIPLHPTQQFSMSSKLYPSVTRSVADMIFLHEVKALVRKSERHLRDKAKRERLSNERISFYSAMATLDRDRNGKISFGELDLFESLANTIVKELLAYLASIGILSTLVLTAVFNKAYDMDIDHHLDWPLILEYIILQVATFVSVVVTFASAGLTVQLSFYLPSNHLRIWYIDRLHELNAVAWIQRLQILSLILMIAAWATHQIRASFTPLSAPVCGLSTVIFIETIRRWWRTNRFTIAKKSFGQVDIQDSKAYRTAMEAMSLAETTSNLTAAVHSLLKSARIDSNNRASMVQAALQDVEVAEKVAKDAGTAATRMNKAVAEAIAGPDSALFNDFSIPAAEIRLAVKKAQAFAEAARVTAHAFARSSFQLPHIAPGSSHGNGYAAPGGDVAIAAVLGDRMGAYFNDVELAQLRSSQAIQAAHAQIGGDGQPVTRGRRGG